MSLKDSYAHDQKMIEEIAFLNKALRCLEEKKDSIERFAYVALNLGTELLELARRWRTLALDYPLRSFIGCYFLSTPSTIQLSDFFFFRALNLNPWSFTHDLLSIPAMHAP